MTGRQRRVTDGIFFALNSFLLSTYEIWKVLVSLAKKKLIANFHVLGLFIPKKKLRAKKNPSVTRRYRSCWRCRPGVGQNLCRRYLSHLKGYIFEISATFRQIGLD
jgi:hypothetical protein